MKRILAKMTILAILRLIILSDIICQTGNVFNFDILGTSSSSLTPLEPNLVESHRREIMFH